MSTFMISEICPSLSKEGSPHLSTRLDVCVVIPVEQVHWLICFFRCCFLFPNSQTCFLSVPSILSFLVHTFGFMNTLQDMPLALLKGGCQWSFLIYQRLLKLKSIVLMYFLLPLYDEFYFFFI